MIRVRTAFESLSSTHSRAALKSLCCSYCLRCPEYFIRIFQYLFFYFCPCRSHTPSYIIHFNAQSVPQASVYPPTKKKKKNSSTRIINKSVCIVHLCQDWAAFSIPRAHANERNYDVLNKICQVGAEKAEASRWLTLVNTGELAS